MSCSAPIQRSGNNVQIDPVTGRVKLKRKCPCDRNISEADCTGLGYWNGNRWPLCRGCFPEGNGDIGPECCGVLMGVNWTMCINKQVAGPNGCNLSLNTSGESRIFLYPLAVDYPGNVNGGYLIGLDDDGSLTPVTIPVTATTEEVDCDTPGTCCPDVTDAYFFFNTALANMRYKYDDPLGWNGIFPVVVFPHWPATVGAGEITFTEYDPRDAGVLTVGDCTPPDGASSTVEFFRL